MIYRIKLSLGYRDCYIDFDNAESASDFATTLLEHYKKPEDEKKPVLKVLIEVVDPRYTEEDDE